MVLALVLLPAFAETLGGHAGRSDGAWLPWRIDRIRLSASRLPRWPALRCLRRLFGPQRRAVDPDQGRAHRLARAVHACPCSPLALGIALGSAAAFGVSFALGAFFAGVIMSESQLSHRAAANSLPLQDAFSVLFFVSIGMLFDPTILVERAARRCLRVLAADRGRQADQRVPASCFCCAIRSGWRSAWPQALRRSANSPSSLPASAPPTGW